MRVSSWLHGGLCMCVAFIAAGCEARRGPNVGMFAGVRLAPSGSDVTGGEDGTTGQLALSAVFYQIRPNEIAAHGRLDTAAGGNGEGFAGALRLEADIGLPVVLSDGDDPVFAFGRGGLALALERDPYTGLTLFELPTLTLGVAYHPSSTEDAIHLEIGARAGLVLAGVAVAGDARAHFALAPEAGAAAAALLDFVFLEISYARIFEDEPLDVGRAVSCLGALFSACIEGRYVHATFGSQQGASTYVGVLLGVGVVSGTFPQ